VSDSEKIAFGTLRLVPEVAWNLTLAELYAMADATWELESKQMSANIQVQDNLNAFNCLMQARCVGSDKGELDDYKLYKEEPKVSNVEKSPEELSNIIMMMAKAGVLKAEGGD
jgi:hypothetical protein